LCGGLVVVMTYHGWKKKASEGRRRNNENENVNESVRAQAEVETETETETETEGGDEWSVQASHESRARTTDRALTSYWSAFV